MSLSKKLFIISGSLFLMLLFLWGIYKAVFEKKNEVSVVKTIEETIETPVTEDQPRIYALTEEKVLSPILTSNGASLKYYDQLTGNVYQIDLDGNNKRTLSSKNLGGLIGVIWSPDKNKVINKFSSDGNTSFSFYDYTEKKSAILNKNIESVVWQNDVKIIYSFFDRENNSKNISLSNPDGTDWKKISDINFNKPFITPIPRTGLVSFWNQPDAFQESSLFSVPIASDSEKQLIFGGKFGADYLWSPDGNSLLISHLLERGESKIQLAITNAKGGEYKNLGIPTIVSKCAWAKNNRIIYYALPGMIPDNAVMPNDYFAKKFKTADTFWKIDITTGKKSRLLELSDLKDTPSLDAIDLFLNEEETILFFTNRNDGKLYRLTL